MRFPTLQILEARRLAPAMAAILIAAAAPARAAEPELVLRSGESRIAQLRAGDSLTVELEGGQPFAFYHFVLSDPTGALIAHQSGKADAAGRAGAKPLWANSGVVGCGDSCAAPDPKNYRFRTYGQAEAALAGRQLEVTVFGAGGSLVARRPLRVVATAEERAYFSDADACPRFRFPPGEKVYVSFHHLEPAAAERRFFLVAEPQTGLALGAVLQEVRDPAFPRLLDLAAASPNATFHVWDPGPHDLGHFSGVTREQALSYPFLLRTDSLLGPGGPKSTAGLSITVDTSGCPPPPGGG